MDIVFFAPTPAAALASAHLALGVGYRMRQKMNKKELD